MDRYEEFLLKIKHNNYVWGKEYIQRIAMIEHLISYRKKCLVVDRNCPRCNCKLEHESNFCPNCGQKLLWR